MSELFIAMLLGHLVGDFLLQTNSMALGKSKPGNTGHFWCTVHCVVYTTSVCVFAGLVNPVFWLLVFISHWPIDRWSLAHKWLKAIGSRDILSAHQSHDEYREIAIAFSCVVYTVADNTMHLVLLWLIAKFV